MRNGADGDDGVASSGGGSDNLRSAPRFRRQSAPDVEELGRLYVDEARTETEIARLLNVSRERVAETLQAAGIARRDGRLPCPVSAAELRRLHVDEKQTVRSLAGRFQTSDIVVQRWLADAGVTSAPTDLDLEEVRRLYVDQQMSMAKTAEKLGSSKHQVQRALVAAGIPRRYRGYTTPTPARAAVTDDRLREVYVERGLNLNDAAKELGVSVWFLRRRLAEAGLAKRPGTFTPHTPYTRAELRAKSSELYGNGMTMRDVAANLGVEISTVRQALHEAGAPVRRGGLPRNTEGKPPRILIDDLYADPAIVVCLIRHDVLVPGSAAWEVAGPTQTLAPLPLSTALVAELYADLGLTAFHISLLCGVGEESVKSRLRLVGLAPRPAGQPSPWMIATYGLPPGSGSHSQKGTSHDGRSERQA